MQHPLVRTRPLHLAALLIALALGGCSGEESTPTPEATSTEPRSEHVWQDQVNTIDKAKGVEAIQDEQFRKQREAIDKQTQ